MSVSTTLAKLPVGSGAVIHSLSIGRTSLTRLREMGLVPGTKVKMIRKAPFGDPIEIQVRGSNIAMRNDEAAHIEITVIAP